MGNYTLDYKKQPSIVITFRLTGDDLRPEIITQALGVTPSRSWSKGDIRSKTNKGELLYTFGCWSTEPAADKQDRFEEQLNRLLEQLESLPPVLHDFIRTFHAEISVGYSSGEYNFGFNLDRQTIQRLCKLGVALDFDIYAIRDKNESENG